MTREASTRTKWAMRRLGDVLKCIEAGVSPKTLDRPAREGEVGVLKVSAVTWKVFRPFENKAVFPEFNVNGIPTVRRGDLLLSRANTAELLASPVLVDRDYPNLVLSDKTLRLVPDERLADGRYLLHALAHEDARRYFASRATGTSGSMRNVTQVTINDCPLPLPPLAEQKRIADILDKADAIRRKTATASAVNNELVASQFNDLFGDPQRGPKQWPVDKLGNLCALDRGRSRNRPRDAAFLYGGPYPFVQTGEIANSNGYVTKFTQTYSEAGLAQSKMWPAGTLCITIAANIAKTAILTFAGCFPDSIVGLIPGDRLTIEYVRHWFVVMQKAIDDAATQVAQKNINLEILRNLEIQLPPVDLQRRFSRFVKQVRALDEHRSGATRQYDELFDSLIQRAFRGDL